MGLMNIMGRELVRYIGEGYGGGEYNRERTGEIY